MEIRTTLTFYSHPAALRDIKEWEKFMIDIIAMKVTYPDEKHRLYVMDHGDNNYEFVICMPMEIFNDGEVIDEQLDLIIDYCYYLINCMCDYQDGIESYESYEINYHKCVVIGDISANKLRKMSHLIFKLERMEKNGDSLIFQKPMEGVSHESQNF